MTTDLTMLKASLETSQAAMRAASCALHSVEAAISALLLQAQAEEPIAADMHVLHKETETPAVVSQAPDDEPAAPLEAEAELEPEERDPALAPLTPEERAAINKQLTGLQPAALKAFTAAFREAFAVPAEVKMIKHEITQQRHGVWILNYLEGLSDGQSK